MTTENIVAGMQILLRHYKKPDGYHTGAEHDAVYMYPTDEPLPSEEVQKLVDLGWFQEDACYDMEAGYKPEDYAPGEGWMAYV